MKNSAKPCAFPGCRNDAAARDLCQGHYQQQRRGLTLRPLRPYLRGSRTCITPNCENLVWTSDRCDACYTHFRRTGGYERRRKRFKRNQMQDDFR